VLVVNHNYGMGKVNYYEKVNGFMKEKLENVNFSKFVNKFYKILGELETSRRTSSLCKFVIFVIFQLFLNIFLYYYLCSIEIDYITFLLKKVKTRNTQMIITNKNMKKVIMNRTYKQGHNYAHRENHHKQRHTKKKS
jgi:hypothetical protein